MLSFALLLVTSVFNKILLQSIKIHNIVLESFGAMCFIAAVEQSKIHKRISLKVLIIFGCSHYRLSFLLFFTTMIASMWCYSITACALMIPLVKAILIELEELGIVEVYENANKLSSWYVLFVVKDINNLRTLQTYIN
ncbi:uncharacterized protein LOC123700439 [Colias croceus]|uniref:uncharacterized protein LOC123700439 n=1 Tax=Colias crocea TaxID=72248 RepID=UPI001E27A498|nr:uncharacterized protein LOC123700439 [Colias croceus]